MTVDPLLLSDMNDFIAEFGDKIVTEQVNHAAKEFQVLDILDIPDEEGRVNPLDAGNTSITQLADGGDTTDGDNVVPEKGVYAPNYFYGSFSLGRGIAKLGVGARYGVNMLATNLSNLSARMTRQMARAVIGNKVLDVDATLAAAVGSATTSFTTSNFAGFRVGQAYDIYDTNVGSVTETFLVTSIVHDPDAGEATITVTRDITSGTPVDWAAGDEIWQRGGKTVASTMVSLKDLAATSGSIYGLTADGEWIGNEADANGASFDDQKLRDLATQIEMRCDEMFNLALVSLRARDSYVNDLVGQRRFSPGDKWDSLGSQAQDPEFMGQRVVASANVDPEDVFLLNTMYTKIHRFVPLHVDGDHSIGGKPANNYLQPVQGKFRYLVEMIGALNVRCEKRASVGRYTNIAP